MADAPMTPEGIAMHEAQEAAWAEEKTWPIWDVVIEGDPVVWVSRNDERYWVYDEESGNWIPRAAKDLPDDATLDKQGNVVRTAQATVTMRARNEDHARMIALRDNPNYHYIVSSTQRENA